MSDKCKDENCGHGREYHADPDNHVLGTSHCTRQGKKGPCMCGEYIA